MHAFFIAFDGGHALSLWNVFCSQILPVNIVCTFREGVLVWFTCYVFRLLSNQQISWDFPSGMRLWRITFGLVIVLFETTMKFCYWDHLKLKHLIRIYTVFHSVYELIQQTTLSYLVGWQSEMSVANLIYSAGQGLAIDKHFSMDITWQFLLWILAVYRYILTGHSYKVCSICCLDNPWQQEIVCSSILIKYVPRSTVSMYRYWNNRLAVTYIPKFNWFYRF